MSNRPKVEASNEICDDSRSPEQNLMVALLARAIRDYIGDVTPDNSIPSKGARCATMRSAQAWVHSKRRDEYSFSHVCESLNLEPDTVIKYIERIQESLGASDIMKINFKDYRRVRQGGTEARTRTHFVISQLDKLLQ